MSDMTQYKYISTSRLTTGGIEIPATKIGNLPKKVIDRALKNKTIKVDKSKTD
jgi:hypothetical protein